MFDPVRHYPKGGFGLSANAKHSARQASPRDAAGSKAEQSEASVLAASFNAAAQRKQAARPVGALRRALGPSLRALKAILKR